MSGKRGADEISTNLLGGRGFHFLPPPGPQNLRIRISSQGGVLDKQINAKTILVISPGCDDQISPEELDTLSLTHNIYTHEIIDALLTRPEALDDEQYINVPRQIREPEEAEEEDGMGLDGEAMEEDDGLDEEELLLSQKRMELENMNAKVDKRRLIQPAPKDLGPRERRWLKMSPEAFMAKTYCCQAEPEDDRRESRYRVTVPLPPSLPGAPPSKRRGDIGNQYHDLFWAPPIGLSNSVKAADPTRREYMQSEDFALLVWFTRTIPYCGVTTPHANEAHFRFNGADNSSLRWNWSRTHGIALRPLASIHERWRHHVADIFFGRTEIPVGTFRRMLAETGFFVFIEDRILGYHIKAIRAANYACAEEKDAAKHDPHLLPTEADDPRELALQTKIRELGEHADVHNGDRWRSNNGQ